MWVPLHVHSQYSILDASASVEDIAQKSAAFGIIAVALTDHGNLFGAIDFYKACKQSKVKPIIGCELYVAPGSRFEKQKNAGGRTDFHLTLLAKNNQGYRNLCKLSSIGYTEGFYYHPRIDYETLQKYSAGIICLSGCLNSRLSHEILNGSHESTLEQLYWYRDLFGEDYYLELQRHPMEEKDLEADGMFQESWLYQQYQSYLAKQTKLNTALVELSHQYKIPLVATNDSHYMEREDWRAHEILLNIQSGEPCEILEKDSMGNPKFRTPNPKRRTYPTHEYYFKSPEQMIALFHDLPEAISNTLKIAEKCNVEIDFKTKHYPVYIPPELKERKEGYTKEEQAQASKDFLWRLCQEGIPKRYTAERLEKVKEIYPDKEPMDVVKERLDYELSIIIPKEMSDYLLIVWDFIHWAKNQGIPVGPGRGSGAGSIVLYLIGITDIEPLRFHLFFERFINPERISYPDIDVDICMDRRNEVIEYTLQKYGKENVAQIITFMTMKAKSAIKDVGRVLDIPLAEVNAITKLVPDDLDITVEKALERDHELRNLYENNEDARRIIEIAKKLEGSVRGTGIHAAGVIIAGEPLTEYIPICNAKDSILSATQFSMKPVEMVGMLKIDFLGLKTLTSIQVCVESIKTSSGISIDWVNLPLEDPPTYALLNQGRTLGIFQLESGGMQDLARQLHLDKFEEIIAVGALYRPGPMDMIPSFINRKHGREAIENDHPWMKEILNETYGIMVYQEQVMQIASKLANFTLGEGDVLRRAMGKKDLEQMAQQREKFRLGALQNGIEEEVSMHIFDKMEKFASYGFNKSHAAAYAYLSYATSYFKANYPKEWLSSLMTCDSDDISKLSKFILECQSMQIAVLPPDINESGKTFIATPQGIRFAMSGIKGVGTGVVEAILEERSRKGRFKSLYQFLKRIDMRRVGKKAVILLIEAGAFDFTGWSKDALLISVEPMYETAAKEQKEETAGVLSLFSLLGESEENRFSKPPPIKHPTSYHELLLKEKTLLGFFLTGHPMDAFQSVLKQLSCVALKDIETLDHNHIFRAAFLIETVQIKISNKSQKKFAILTISDGSLRFELPIWPELFEQKNHLLLENQLLYAILRLEKEEGAIKLSCHWLESLQQTNEAMIEACDRAFDAAKQQVNRYGQSKGNNNKELSKDKIKEKSKPQEKGTPMTKKLVLHFNAYQMRLSHIIKIKEVLGQHRGTTPLQIDFQAGDQMIGSLHIDQGRGITVNPHLLQTLREIPAFLHLKEEK